MTCTLQCGGVLAHGRLVFWRASRVLFPRRRRRAQVDGHVTGEIVTRTLATRNPQLHLETRLPLRSRYFAVELRRGDADLTHWVGHATVDLPVF